MIISGREILQMAGTSINDAHVQASMAMMIEAASMAGNGSAALLGCGRGSEIPVRQLARKFDRLDCVDLDSDALRILETRCRHWEDSQGRCCFYYSDLTGLIPQIVPQAQKMVAASFDPLFCLYRLGTLLTSAQPDFWKLSSSEKYSLVICSAVLTQLQATVRKSVENIFLDRFPGQASALFSYEPWKTAIWSFARDLEDAFILHLESLCHPEGIIYLSDTVHVCWLQQTGPDVFTTEGAWVATRTSRLADYLRARNEIITERQWRWMRAEQEGPYCGRLYGVQAIIYRKGESERRLP